ncbi:MAG: 4Fe-4S dicluster domain-containing protein [Candidatus Lokiarchaeota archaeon]|nr:4Fe-4S dicluster domain-containing protein [Candidatus Lokiarchaeota archaeon]
MTIDSDYRETWRVIDRRYTCDVWQHPEEDGVIYGTRVGIHRDSCTFCMKCIDVCPTNVFEYQSDSNGFRVVVPTREDDCIDCLACEMVCPTDAISIESRAGSESTLKALLDGEE